MGGLAASFAARRFVASNFDSHAPSRSQEEMPRAARRIDDPQGEDRFARVFGMIGNRLGEDRLQRRFNQLVHEGRGRVVRARQLALGASALFAAEAIANKAKTPRRSAHVHHWLKLQEAFVY